MKLTKRIVCMILSLMMIMNMTSLFSTAVFAEKPNSYTYSTENFKVDYTVTDSWGNNQIVQVKLTNIGKENIENWALKFKADGKIENLWGAKLIKHENTEYIIESAPYNFILKPNQSITFGYKYISDKGDAPKTFELCSKRAEKKDGYIVNLKVINSGDDESTCQIEIKNTSQNPIKLWEIEFDGDFQINNVWNATLIKSENGKHKIKSTDETNIIEPNSSAIIGMQCKKTNDLQIKNSKLSEVVINTSSDIVDLKLFLIATYNQENKSIILNWNSTVSEGNFDIQVSTDGTNYTTVNSVSNLAEYEYKATNNADKLYFKVIQTTADGKSVESNTVTLIKDDDDYNLEDSDKDGLPDAYENMIGTNPLKADTDGDGLSDYEELYITNTDPLKADTDGNGILDGNEDLDSDGLTNIQEIKYGTDPLISDTDSDGLNDGDEVNKYKTDPLKADTDEDGINDGDEIKLGLNPLTKYTKEGILDSEVKFEQKISNDTLKNINTPDNPFELDIKINATGYGDSNLIAGTSGYSNAMAGNTAIQGAPVQLDYNNGKVEKTTIKFKLKDSLLAKANETAEKELSSTSKLERYHIFRYDEEYNFLYPVKTIEDGDTIYTETDKLGTYCVMDLLEWDKTLQDNSQPQSISTTNSNQEVDLSDIEQQINTLTEQINDDSFANLNEQQKNELCEKLLQEQIDEIHEFDSQNKTDIKSKSQEDKKKMDIVIAVDSTRLMANGLDLDRPNFANSYCTQSTFFISKLITSMNRKGNIDWRICLIDFKKYPNDGDNARTIYTAPNGSIWFDKGSDIVEKLRTIEQKTKVAKKSTQTSWDSLGYATEELKYRDGAVRQAVLMTNQDAKDDNRYNIKDINEMSEKLLKKGIRTHFVTHMDSIDYYTPLRKTTKGLYAFYFYNFILYFPQSTVDYIVNAEPLPIGSNTNVITSYGLEKIDTSNILGEHLNKDLDGDGLSNKQEIRTDLIKDEVTLNNLMTMKQFSEKIDTSTIGGFTKELLSKNSDMLVLPLKSDPRKIDSDGDGFLDSINNNYNKSGYYKIADKWPLSSKPRPEFYQKDGNYYFNELKFPSTNVGGRKKNKIFSSQNLKLTEEEQKYIYDLCKVANSNKHFPETDPLLVMAICAHESSCTSIINYLNFTGYMQINPNHVIAYCNEKKYYNNDSGRMVKDIINTMLLQNRLNSYDFNLLKSDKTNVSTVKNIILDPYVNLTFGVAKLHECIFEKENSWDGLCYYCSIYDVHSPREDYYYRNHLASFIKERSLYEEKYF